LPENDARALLSAAIPGRVDGHVRDRIVAETRGNPLALLELPKNMASEPTQKSAPSYISAPARLNGIYARCSPSSASPRAVGWATRCPPEPGPANGTENGARRRHPRAVTNPRHGVYKSSVDVAGAEINDALIAHLFPANIVTVDRYLVGLGKVVDGADPAITIAAVEASPT
jgi:hypothetical protein